MNQILMSERLFIREFIKDDIKMLYELENDPLVIKYIPGSRKTSMYECEQKIKYYINDYKYNSAGIWVVAIKGSNFIIGITGFRYLDDIKKMEIGIKLFPKYWSNGYATETGKALINYGLNNLMLSEIIAMAVPENIKSVKSLENIGMRFDGFGYFRGSKVVFYSAS